MEKKTKKIIKSFKNAINGIVYVFRTQRNFKIQLFCFVIVLAAALYFKLTLTETAIVVFAGGLVLVSEIMNTSIEKMVDLIKPEYHPTARKAKDVAAGIVLCSAIVAVVLGIIIFLPKILEWF